MPADEKQMKLASLMYYQVYGEDLPLQNYRQQDIEYIIEQLRKSLATGEKVFNPEILH